MTSPTLPRTIGAGPLPPRTVRYLLAILSLAMLLLGLTFERWFGREFLAGAIQIVLWGIDALLALMLLGVLVQALRRRTCELNLPDITFWVVTAAAWWVFLQCLRAPLVS